MQDSEVVLLSVPEVAEHLAIKKSIVRAWLLHSWLEYVRVGKRSVRIPLSEVQRIIAEATVPAREPRNAG
jgi:excisionase family DNA binding protein